MNAEMPQMVSIIMPVYNAAPWIATAIGGLIAQTHSNFELLIGDDGSTDASLQLVEAAAVDDPRIKVYSFHRQGVVQTRNALIAKARGHYIMFHDADDLSVPWRVATQIAFLEAHPDFIGVSSRIYKFRGEIDASALGPRPVSDGWSGWAECSFRLQPFKYHKKNFPFPACMIRHSAVAESGGFRPYFSYAEDADFIYRMSEVGKLGLLHDVLFYYRQHDSNTARRAPYRQTESSVLARVFALRRQRARADTVNAAQPSFLRIFTSGLSPGEQAQALWLLATRLTYRIIKNARHRAEVRNDS